jgi:FAD synthase
MEVNTFYVLLDRFNLKGIVCGYDYSFGRGGLGTPNGLKNYCAERGIEFVCIEPVKMIGERVSSTSIRELLKIGDITLVNMLLGERFVIGGTVVHGDEIGRTIGLPTANLNINIKEKQLPEDGVYCGYTTIDNNSYQCLVHIGGRPTINRDEKRVEVHIKNFDGNLYGRYIYAELSKRIRGIEKFSDIDTLKKQILKDLNENIW